jgi:hypothetical protein
VKTPSLHGPLLGLLGRGSGGAATRTAPAAEVLPWEREVFPVYGKAAQPV